MPSCASSPWAVSARAAGAELRRGSRAAGNLLHRLVQRLRRARLNPGETLLVHGGTSGIGLTAIQLGKALAHGARHRWHGQKCDACLAFSARPCHQLPHERFRRRGEAVYPRARADVILDMVAGDYIARDISCVAEDGRIVIIAAGATVEFDVWELLRRRVTITVPPCGHAQWPSKRRLPASCAATRMAADRAGQIRPVIAKTFPAVQAAQPRLDGVQRTYRQDRAVLDAILIERGS